MSKKIGWIAMTLLAVGVAIYAGAVLGLPATRSPIARGAFTRSPMGAFGHVLGGSLALAIGPFQANGRLRGRWPAVHRGFGHVYVVAVLGGGLAALVLAPRSFGGLVAHMGFVLLAVCWLVTTITAYVYIQRGDFVAHGRWMIRSYALTLAAVTLRVYVPLSLAAGLPFESSYPVIGWLCWVPNLLVAEWYLRRRAPFFAPSSS